MSSHPTESGGQAGGGPDGEVFAAAAPPRRAPSSCWPYPRASSARARDEGARLGGSVVPLAPAIMDAARKANLSKITLGIRPEAMAPSSNSQGLRMETTLVEELGADAYVSGTIQGDDPLTDKQFVVRLFDGRTPPHIGETLFLDIKADEEHAFNPETGERLG